VNKELTVMMLTWEFPPRIIGGISSHVYHLSRSLVRNGVKVFVVTCDYHGAPPHEVIDGVEVFRVDSYKDPSPDFVTWVYLMNMNMQRKAAALVKKLDEKIDLFHAHDWLVANAGIGLKHVFRRPLLATIHATEVGRNGVQYENEKMIHETEYWLTYEAWRVICCSNFMVSHAKWAFGLPEDKLVMIPNGVDIREYEKNTIPDLSQFRRNFALPEEKIVLFVGRLVYEKGIHVLVDAIPKVLEKVNAKFVIVGNGYMKEHLSGLLDRMGLAHKTFFTGFVDCETLRSLQKSADVCVAPSLFEPFGIVALEAMAAKSPLVVSDTGGLSEIVEHDVTGVKVYPDNTDSLAWGITRVLLDENYANRLKNNAYRKVQENYNWDKISQRTKTVYETVSKERSRTIWT